MLLGALSYQWIQGRNGLFAAETVRADIMTVERALEKEQSAIVRLELTLGLLEPAALDADLVGEILRQELYWISPFEYIVVMTSTNE